MTTERTAICSKPLDQMNSLKDMGRFPPLVNAGATLNVLVTVAVTWSVCERFAEAPESPWSLVALPAWIALVLVLNLMPVVVLRAIGWRAGSPMPVVEEMNFFGDQHRFADWVYLAASANMAFWITLCWCAFILLPGTWTLPAVLLLAFGATFSPVLVQAFGAGFRSQGKTKR